MWLGGGQALWVELIIAHVNHLGDLRKILTVSKLKSQGQFCRNLAES